MSKIKGSTAAPAAVAEYPDLNRFKEKEKENPIAEYKNSGKQVRPLSAGPNRASGSIGELS